MPLHDAVRVAYDATYTTKRTRYAALLGRMWTDRASFDAHWRELADVMRPPRVRFCAGTATTATSATRTSSTRRPRFARRTLQSGCTPG